MSAHIPKFALSLLFSCLASAAPISEAFPVVDLGYARHAPTKVNVTSTNNISYATYSNIRFAQPPIGNLRFKAPQTPPPASEGIQDGVVPLNSTNCLQAIPKYFPLPGSEGTSWGSEDCLFLDVYVPEGVKYGESVPVVHWIYGGGYFFGAKDTGYSLGGLFDDMTEDEKFIIVASNYRLATLGWMSSDEEPSMTRNVGLYDALAALQWTAANIHWFGGDGNRITAMGESAGAGVIEHLLAANTQGNAMPFNQAIISSAGHRPHVNRSLEMTELYHMFLDQTECSDLECLRSLDTESIAAANSYLFIDAPPDGFPGPGISFAPILDDNLVKDLPERVMQDGNTKPTTGHIKRIMVGDMQNDGAASTIGNFTSWKDQLSIFCRTPTSSSAGVLQSIYGAYNGSGSSFLPDGTVELTPFDEFNNDIIFHCHSQSAAKAYSSQGSQGEFWQQYAVSSSSYRYQMSIPPALHAQDLNYWFYDQSIATYYPETVGEVARSLQRYLRTFILGQELEGWPEYGSAGLEQPVWMNITSDGFQTVTGQDEAELAGRCEAIIDLFSNPHDGW